MTALSNLLFTLPNLIIVLGVWSLLVTLKKVFVAFFNKPLVNRLLPLYPLALCIAANFIPGVQDKTMGWGDLLLLGLVQGVMVGQAHKILTQVGLGQGVPFGDDDAPAPAPVAPPDPVSSVNPAPPSGALHA